MLPLVVRADQLATKLNEENLRIIDLSSKDHYLQAHIPGAIHFDSAQLMLGKKPVPNKLPALPALQRLLNELSIEKNSHIIAYDDQNGPLAGRLIWTLHCLGITNCSYLDGHLAAWESAGYATSQVPTKATSHNKPIIAEHIYSKYIADIDFIVKQLENTDHTIWDARSTAEYHGEKVINAHKGGHIPGAVSFEWTRCLTDSDPKFLLDRDQLRQNLTLAGINLEKPVITHCQTHRRSGLTYIAALHAGIEHVSCYDGSWFEWGNHPTTPVES